MYVQFLSLLHIDMTQVIEILPHVRQGQYNGCWYPCDAKTQGISKYDIDPVNQDE